MRVSRLGFHFGTALLFVSTVAELSSCRTVDRTLGEAHIPCGAYRWKIKVLADPEAESVRPGPIDTTVAELTRRPLPPAFDARRRNADELSVYRVRAILVAVHPRIDQDLHLFLRDPSDPSSHLIAEIPNPPCAEDSRHVSEFASARKVAEALRSSKAEIAVEVEGVGFFDEYHEAKGSAPNGFELHPVLSLREVTPIRDTR